MGNEQYLREYLLETLKPNVAPSRLDSLVDRLVKDLPQHMQSSQLEPELDTTDGLESSIDYSKVPMYIYSDIHPNMHRSRPFTANTRMGTYSAFQNVFREIPDVKIIIDGDQSHVANDQSLIIQTVQWTGYMGKMNGATFDTREGGPLVVSYGSLHNIGYKQASEQEYGFIYAVNSDDNNMVGRNAHRDAIFLMLPRQYYQDLVNNNFRDFETLIRSVLGEDVNNSMNPKTSWLNYLDDIGFFTKPRLIAEISK